MPEKQNVVANYGALEQPSESSESSTITVDVDHENTRLISDDVLPEISHHHYSDRSPWLRAAVLGANDGLVSTASLIVGFAGSSEDHNLMILSGAAALVAGALSMACGEYVSVATQKDTESADMVREKAEFLKGPLHIERELRELAGIYEARGISPQLALQVAEELHSQANGDIDEIVKVHLREELNVDVDELSNPVQAAVTSALCFSAGAAIPLSVAIFVTDYQFRLAAVVVASTFGLIINGLLGAYLGGAPVWKGAIRVLVGGWIAMIGTFLVGKAFHVQAV
ncbi:VIT family-domain-containing protein [Fimicolochytrium jonesii]|uniref:VIT family-domain-containing protein n=1 Tax=Fimicolochytrium jonesii TaxID=1396493 RepID=UPI0022FEDAA8|nr:VIT family-domain-containing protein [Fimicolochytrium jonesii]KAI8817114.1 VIT family-domain-containing protein [Fimicolochytrium jonesii]